MGYSIMTLFNSKKEQKDMEKFLRSNFRDANTITGDDIYIYSRGPSTRLGYAPNSGWILGFDYNSGSYDFEREYTFQICAWMAKMAGKKARFEGKMLPFLLYDGIEKIAVTDQEIEFKKDTNQRVVDEFGFCASSIEELSTLYEEFDGGIDAAKKTTQNELMRLTEKYRVLHKGK